MIRRILCPIDGSSAARAALSIAASTCGILSAKLVALFVEDERRLSRISLAMAMAENLTGQMVTETPLSPEEIMEEEARMEKESVALFSEFQTRCEESHIQGSFLSLRGAPAQIIARQSIAADLVVIGQRGLHHGVEARAKGATLMELLRETTAPVVVVPEDPRGSASIVLAYDGSRAAQRTLRVVGELSELADIDEVYVATVTVDAEEGKRVQEPALTYLGEYDLEVHSRLLSGNPSTALLGLVEEVSPSFVALGAFGGNRIREMIFGSTTEEIIRRATCAVLLVPA